jgi:glycine oxidase
VPGARSTIVIAGAGAIGAVAAYGLARAGHAVTLVDPGPPGANASGVAAGMLAPAFESLFDAGAGGRFGVLAAARDLWPPLAAEIGLPLARDGALAIGTQAQVRGWLAALSDAGAEAAAAELPDGRAAAFTPEDWRLDAPSALLRLRAAAAQRGVRTVTGRVCGLAGGRVLIEDAAAIAADALMVATGAARSPLAPELAVLTPVKGHILRAAGDFPAGPVLRTRGAYLCRNGPEAILGATMESGRDDLFVDPAVAERLLADAAELTLGLGPVRWRAAVGVRAATPDGLPLVGRSAAPGVLVAVGARRNGWLLAPMIADVLLACVEGRAADRAALFDPARFGPSPG